MQKGPQMTDRKYRWWESLRVAWVDPLVRKALRGGTLSESDLYLPEDSHTDSAHSLFECEWKRAKGQATPEKLSEGSCWLLLGCLWKLYGRDLLKGGAFKLCWSALVICGAFYFVRSLLDFVDTKDTGNPYTETWTGWVLGTGFFIAAALWGATQPTACQVGTSLMIAAY